MILAIDFTTLAPLIKDMTFIEWIITIITLLTVTAIPFFVKWLFEKIKDRDIKKEDLDKNINHHANCPYFGDEYYYEIIEPFINKAVQKTIKIHDLRKALIDSQMSSSDKSMITIKQKMMEEFKKSDEITNRDMRSYSKILDYTLSKTKKEKLKQYVIDNHFAEKSDDSWKLYRTSTVTALQSFHIMALDEEYYSEDFTLSRKDLFELNKPIMNSIRDELYNLFDEIRDIAIKYNKEIEELENEVVPRR